MLKATSRWVKLNSSKEEANVTDYCKGWRWVSVYGFHSGYYPKFGVNVPVRQEVA